MGEKIEFVERLKLAMKRLALAGRDLFDDFQANGCFLQAATLSYTSFLSLVPLVAISAASLARFSAFARYTDDLLDIIFRFIPKEETGMRKIVSDHVATFAENAFELNAAGIIALFAGVFVLFYAIEDALNSVWNVSERRSWPARFATATSIMTWWPILVAVAIGAISAIEDGGYLAEYRVISRILLVIPLALAVLGFSLAYRLIPYTDVKFSAALVGGAVAGALWIATYRAFFLYAARSLEYNIIYGALGVLPLFLMWLYLSWVIFLAGAIGSFVFQNGLRRNRRGAAYGGGSALPLAALVIIARRFLHGDGKTSQKEISKSLGVSFDAAAGILATLSSNGWVENVGTSTNFLPTLEPASLTVREVRKALEGDPHGLPDEVRQVFEKLDESVGDVTIANLAEPTGGE